MTGDNTYILMSSNDAASVCIKKYIY